MPHVLDRSKRGRNTHKGNAKAIAKEFDTAVGYGQEIEGMIDAALLTEVRADLLPALESICANHDAAQAKTLTDLRDWNEKANKWVDDKQLNP